MQGHATGANELGMLGGKQHLTACRTIAKSHEADVVLAVSALDHRYRAPPRSNSRTA